MPYEHRARPRLAPAAVRLLAMAAFLVGAVLVARRAETLQLRFGGWFVTGILIGGMVYRVRELLRLRRAGCRIDADAVAWRTAWDEGRVAWNDVVRCMLVQGRGLSLRLKQDNGQTDAIPPLALPDDPEPILAVLRAEVLPVRPWIRLSLDERDITPPADASGGATTP